MIYQPSESLEYEFDGVRSHVVIGRDLDDELAAFAAEASTFWDDSLTGLPDYVVEHLHATWTTLLTRTRVVVMRGHRGVDAGAVVTALLEALAG